MPVGVSAGGSPRGRGAAAGGRAGAVGDVRVERLRLPHLRAAGQQLHVEVVDVQAQRGEVVGVEQRAGREVVVLAQRVGEALPDDR